MVELKRTPIYDAHREAGASFVPFAGWEMPISYTGIKDEHLAVRNAVGLFDVSHMGDIWVKGKDATSFLSWVTTANPTAAKAGDCIYTHILNIEGGIIDDMIATKFSEECYLCVPNASMKDQILDWFKENRKDMEVEFIDVTEKYVCLALQGPKANGLLQEMTVPPLEDVKFFKSHLYVLENGRLVAEKPIEARDECGIGSGEVLISRTGYTGEDGFELICRGEEGVVLWKTLMKRGEERGIKPIGLGARDTLRLEKGFLLSGTDFHEDRSSLETGWDFVIAWDHDFIGKPVLERQKEEGHHKLRGILVEGRGIPRTGMSVLFKGEVVGEITSGSFSPMLEKGIALAYLPKHIKKGDVLEIEIRGKCHPAAVVKTPFVK
ncbi:MAG: glycine cleavage system aminomethyltransferase GcvT [Thermoplasmata archaeon]|nr:glycine cleavage system aminomethyltransferase GcvT [Thermoplasmata archaeon]